MARTVFQIMSAWLLLLTALPVGTQAQTVSNWSVHAYIALLEENGEQASIPVQLDRDHLANTILRLGIYVDIVSDRGNPWEGFPSHAPDPAWRDVTGTDQPPNPSAMPLGFQDLQLGVYFLGIGATGEENLDDFVHDAAMDIDLSWFAGARGQTLGTIVPSASIDTLESGYVQHAYDVYSNLYYGIRPSMVFAPSTIRGYMCHPDDGESSCTLQLGILSTSLAELPIDIHALRVELSGVTSVDDKSGRYSPIGGALRPQVTSETFGPPINISICDDSCN